MRIDIISVVPELMESPFGYSIIKRAIDKQLVEVHFHNLHDYTNNTYRQVDDYQFGGGAGMVLMIEPIDKCISALKAERDYDEVIFLTPDGDTLQQKMANQLSLAKNLIILCGHFKGVDQRVRDHFITKEISIGDYVLSGGELGAAVALSLVSSLMKPQPLPIRFKTICWLHQSIHVLLTTRVGKYPKFLPVAIPLK